ncbi:hypothetical protein GUJ93_ZPchr0004g39436 [Zizania palustris]|uniref:Uncharacterized protein n=1 Tax=Zizania palustris TaxID=103762 RepID=A0A8J5SDP8_ZIZPA|nr:hypothetical protein GUJ93_ZPchr0004g39436 [Zizania palustris]
MRSPCWCLAMDMPQHHGTIGDDAKVSYLGSAEAADGETVMESHHHNFAYLRASYSGEKEMESHRNNFVHLIKSYDGETVMESHHHSFVCLIKSYNSQTTMESRHHKLVYLSVGDLSAIVPTRQRRDLIAILQPLGSEGPRL